MKQYILIYLDYLHRMKLSIYIIIGTILIVNINILDHHYVVIIAYIFLKNERLNVF